MLVETPPSEDADEDPELSTAVTLLEPFEVSVVVVALFVEELEGVDEAFDVSEDVVVVEVLELLCVVVAVLEVLGVVEEVFELLPKLFMTAAD